MKKLLLVLIAFLFTIGCQENEPVMLSDGVQLETRGEKKDKQCPDSEEATIGYAAYYFDLETGDIIEEGAEGVELCDIFFIFKDGKTLMRWAEIDDPVTGGDNAMALVYNKNYCNFKYKDIEKYTLCPCMAGCSPYPPYASDCGTYEDPAGSYLGLVRTIENNYFLVEFLSANTTGNFEYWTVEFRYRELLP